MDILSIAKELNNKFKESSLSDFQKARSQRLGKTRPNTYEFFSSSTIHNDDGYAYHSGGRTELQFNIALESDNEFRYGIAISLQADRFLKNPIVQMSDRIQRINDLIERCPEIFDDLEMWRFYDDHRSKNQPVTNIPHDWIKNNSFIFIGTLAKLDGVNKFPESLYEEVVKQFENFMPVYEFVEGPNETSERYRIARITWNTNGWKRPSGPEGKVRNPKNFEYKAGFGHEEWLFDTDRLINGWHYGFLQGLGYFYEKYQGKQFNLLLYSVNSITKERFWIGRITNIECVPPDLSEKAHEIYQRKGWLDEMEREAIAVGANGGRIRKEQNVGMINCRFRPANLQIFDEPRPRIPLKDKHLKALYYDTLTKIPPSRYIELAGDQDNSVNLEIPDDLSAYGATGIEKRQSKSWNKSGDGIRSDLRHKEWEKHLLESLRKNHGTRNVGIGVRCGRGYADIVININKKKILIELKTAHTAYQVLREALAQILEYGYWPGERRANVRLAVAGTPKLDTKTEQYLTFLRDELEIPIWYLRVDEAAMSLEGLDEVAMSE